MAQSLSGGKEQQPWTAACVWAGRMGANAKTRGLPC